MTDRPAGPEHEIAELQARLRQQHEQLRSLTAGQPGYDDAARAVIERTFELIDLEERLPLLLDETRREVSRRVVRWAGLVSSAVVMVCAVAAALGWVSRWWLPLLALLLPATLLLLVVPVSAPGDRHPAQRVGAGLIAAAAALTPLVITGLFGVWAVVPVILVAAAGVGYLVRVTVPPAQPTRRASEAAP
jgi:hypothetical protein